MSFVPIGFVSAARKPVPHFGMPPLAPAFGERGRHLPEPEASPTHSNKLDTEIRLYPVTRKLGGVLAILSPTLLADGLLSPSGTLRDVGLGLAGLLGLCLFNNWQARPAALADKQPGSVSWPDNIKIYASSNQKVRTLGANYTNKLLDLLESGETGSLEAAQRELERTGYRVGWGGLPPLKGRRLLEQKAVILPESTPTTPGGWDVKRPNPERYILIIAGNTDSKKESQQVVDSMLRFETVFQMVFQVPPAHCLTIDGNSEDSIRRGIRELAGRLEGTRDPEVVIYYCGHGMAWHNWRSSWAMARRDLREGDKTFYMLGDRLNRISERALAGMMTRDLPSNARIHLILNACKSGAALNF